MEPGEFHCHPRVPGIHKHLRALAATVSPKFGVDQVSTLVITAFDMQAVDSTIGTASTVDMQRYATSLGEFFAGVHLPQGALILNRLRGPANHADSGKLLEAVRVEWEHPQPRRAGHRARRDGRLPGLRSASIPETVDNTVNRYRDRRGEHPLRRHGDFQRRTRLLPAPGQPGARDSDVRRRPDLGPGIPVHRSALSRRASRPGAAAATTVPTVPRSTSGARWRCSCPRRSGSTGPTGPISRSLASNAPDSIAKPLIRSARASLTEERQKSLNTYMERKIVQIGSSLAVTLPSEVVKEFRLKKGQEVEVSVHPRTGAVTIRLGNSLLRRGQSHEGVSGNLRAHPQTS